ncbi:hypothetical protein BT96DRAFT_1000224 [Gymnopus androsaceus JB14]|uniref:Uncharacterized protein n=1 Tax=Gymnopus androsaceus JB14 TaxID=1447944 RepID=A0A6A4H486_9AGAR|nr:hypothetical protein BT96DRAFT_1000224 [Gymnopus androsaceus JB14]
MRRRRRKQYPLVPFTENTSRDLDLGVFTVLFRSDPRKKPAQATTGSFGSKGGYHTHAAPSTGTVSAPVESPGERANILPEAPNNDVPYLDSGIRFPDRPPPDYTVE